MELVKIFVEYGIENSTMIYLSNYMIDKDNLEMIKFFD